MSDWLILLLIAVGWIFVVRVVFPRLGIKGSGHSSEGWSWRLKDDKKKNKN